MGFASLSGQGFDAPIPFLGLCELIAEVYVTNGYEASRMLHALIMGWMRCMMDEKSDAPIRDSGVTHGST